MMLMNCSGLLVNIKFSPSLFIYPETAPAMPCCQFESGRTQMRLTVEKCGRQCCDEGICVGGAGHEGVAGGDIDTNEDVAVPSEVDRAD